MVGQNEKMELNDRFWILKFFKKILLDDLVTTDIKSFELGNIQEEIKKNIKINPVSMTHCKLMLKPSMY